MMSSAKITNVISAIAAGKTAATKPVVESCHCGAAAYLPEYLEV